MIHTPNNSNSSHSEDCEGCVETHLAEAVLESYDVDVAVGGVVPVSHPAGLGGADHWFVESYSGPLCLRRQRLGVPGEASIERVQYSQAVLWHAMWEGFELVPLPLENRSNCGFICAAGGLWELLPWFDGEKEEMVPQSVSGYPSLPMPYRAAPHARIVSAMLTLAQFHGATATFPLPYPVQATSCGLTESLATWRWWLDGNLERLRHDVATREIPREMKHRAEAFFSGLETIHGSVDLHLERGARLCVPIQPSLGNAHRRHLLFDDGGVCGLLDMRQIGADNVAADVASLLGSLAGSDTMLWNYGMLAYESIRPLNDDELLLVHAFNIASLVLTGLSLLHRVYWGGTDGCGEQLSQGQYNAIASELAWQEYRLTSLRCRRRNSAA